MDPFFISTTSCIVEGKCTMEGILEGDAVAYSYNEVIPTYMKGAEACHAN